MLTSDHIAAIVAEALPAYFPADTVVNAHGSVVELVISTEKATRVFAITVRG